MWSGRGQGHTFPLTSLESGLNDTGISRQDSHGRSFPMLRSTYLDPYLNHPSHNKKGSHDHITPLIHSVIDEDRSEGEIDFIETRAGQRGSRTYSLLEEYTRCF